ncbi:hypothetical protein [Thermococcus peptonophilus]|uniref:hypothetical protein n=1 Tax=Thermococcus peptonophilus TaxID=53952 RepID=UPI00373FDC0F
MVMAAITNRPPIHLLCHHPCRDLFPYHRLCHGPFLYPCRDRIRRPYRVPCLAPIPPSGPKTAVVSSPPLRKASTASLTVMVAGG